MSIGERKIGALVMPVGGLITPCIPVVPQIGRIRRNAKHAAVYKPLRYIQKSEDLAGIANLRRAGCPSDIVRPFQLSVKPHLQRIASGPEQMRIADGGGLVRRAAINRGRLD